MLELSIVQKIAVWALPLIFAITLHEVAHGFVASRFGDHTARLSGRLTINPIAHIDLVGTVIVPILMIVMGVPFIFGWAKPVPVDARNMANPRRDMAIVALAGPVSNLLMALAWGFIAKAGFVLSMSGHAWFGLPLALMGQAGIIINVVLGVLNLIPIPPLDGGRVMMSLLPTRAAYTFSMIEPYGFIILLLLLASGVLSLVMAPFIHGIAGLIAIVTGLT